MKRSSTLLLALLVLLPGVPVAGDDVTVGPGVPGGTINVTREFNLGRGSTHFEILTEHCEGGKPIGKLFATIEDGVLEFGDVAVHPDFQGQGLSKKLYANLFAEPAVQDIDCGRSLWAKTNRRIFLEGIEAGLDPLEAARATPAGKTWAANGFDLELVDFDPQNLSKDIWVRFRRVRCPTSVAPEAPWLAPAARLGPLEAAAISALVGEAFNFFAQAQAAESQMLANDIQMYLRPCPRPIDPRNPFSEKLSTEQVKAYGEVRLLERGYSTEKLSGYSLAETQKNALDEVHSTQTFFGPAGYYIRKFAKLWWDDGGPHYCPK